MKKIFLLLVLISTTAFSQQDIFSPYNKLKVENFLVENHKFTFSTIKNNQTTSFGEIEFKKIGEDRINTIFIERKKEFYSASFPFRYSAEYDMITMGDFAYKYKIERDILFLYPFGDFTDYDYVRIEK